MGHKLLRTGLNGDIWGRCSWSLSCWGFDMGTGLLWKLSILPPFTWNNNCFTWDQVLSAWHQVLSFQHFWHKHIESMTTNKLNHNLCPKRLCKGTYDSLSNEKDSTKCFFFVFAFFWKSREICQYFLKISCENNIQYCKWEHETICGRICMFIFIKIPPGRKFYSIFPYFTT